MRSLARYGPALAIAAGTPLLACAAASELGWSQRWLVIPSLAACTIALALLKRGEQGEAATVAREGPASPIPHGSSMEHAGTSAMTALGVGVAHEINNPLAGVLALTQVLKQRLEQKGDNEEHVALLRQVEREALRIRAIVHGLLDLTRQQGGADGRRLDINKTVDQAIGAVADELSGSGVTVVRKYGDDLPSPIGHADRIHWAVEQVVRNAHSAMLKSNGGTERTIEVRTRCSGANVEIEISDTGCGIAPDHIDRVFEPFFTTKLRWNAMGLGLTAVHSIMEAHQGSVRVQSVPGQGTQLTISIPTGDRKDGTVQP